jgi:hypothetical protein
MADQIVETSTTGFMGNMGKSIMAVPIGILLFFLSFFVFWKTEGRTDWSKVAATSTEVSADSPSGSDGAFVSVTGALTSPEKLGDPDFLAPGDFITLDRVPQMYAWVENKKTDSKKKVGGKTETTTTYTYVKEWTRSPKASSEFRDPTGHQNPAMSIAAQDFVVGTAKVGAWGFTPSEAGLPSGGDLSLGNAQLIGKGTSAQKVGDELFIGTGTPDVPVVGDVKVAWDALPAGQKVTLFGDASGGTLSAHMHKDEDRFFRALSGTRAEAIATLKSEYKAKGWVGRVVGFLMMWIGMTMVFAPLHGIMDILPFMGKVSRGLVGCITFPIALVLSAITIVISMLLHSILAMVIVTLILGGLGFFAWKRKQAEAGA